MAKNLRLITETNNIETKKKDRKLFISGLFQQAEKKNKNGRVYPKELLQEQVQRLQPKISKKSLFGQMGHPHSPEGNPSQISHRIDELKWSGNDLYGKALVLNTSSGKDLKAIIEAGSQIMVSSRSVGDWDRKSGIVSEDGFKLISFDIVEQGGVADAFVRGIYEGATSSWSPCQVAKLLEQEEEARQCECPKCGRLHRIPQGDCADYSCSVCHEKGLKPYGISEQDHYSDKVFECFCPNCETYTNHRNKKCSEVKCETCQMTLKSTGKVYDSEELFQEQLKEWKTVIETVQCFLLM